MFLLIKHGLPPNPIEECFHDSPEYTHAALWFHILVGVEVPEMIDLRLMTLQPALSKSCIHVLNIPFPKET